jgi:Protein of unknown function (DUF1566)
MKVTFWIVIIIGLLILATVFSFSCKSWEGEEPVDDSDGDISGDDDDTAADDDDNTGDDDDDDIYDDDVDDDDEDDDDEDDDADDDDLIDNGDGTATDPFSGLMWQNPPLGRMKGWDDAKTYCNNLFLGGRWDWRLPSITELRSLIRGCDGTETGGSCAVTDSCNWDSCRYSSCYECSLDGGPSGGCYWPSQTNGECFDYWSSSEVADDVYSAWRVGFDDGHVSKMLDHWRDHVRCVR